METEEAYCDIQKTSNNWARNKQLKSFVEVTNINHRSGETLKEKESRHTMKKNRLNMNRNYRDRESA